MLEHSAQEKSAQVERPDAVAPQMAPAQDATISSLTLTADGSNVALSPPFDPDTTHYTATVNAAIVRVAAATTRGDARIVATVTGGTPLTLLHTFNALAVNIPLPEGRITDFSFTVRAEDAATTRTYHVAMSRPAGSAVPDITITANRAEYVAGFGDLLFTLTRSGDTADDLDVTVNLVQTPVWLNFTSFTATFPAGDSTTTYRIFESDFLSEATQSGDLTATVVPVSGYDLSEARTRVRMIYLAGPAISVALEHSAYTFDEDAGAVDVVLVARAIPGLPYVSDLVVSLSSDAQEASSGLNDGTATGDYIAVSTMVHFAPSDFVEEGGSLVGRKAASITILEDNIREGDELFHIKLERSPSLTPKALILDAAGEECSSQCANPYVVTIIDNEGPAVTAQFGQNVYTVVEGTSQDVIVALSDDPERTVVIPITATDQDGATGADYSIVPLSVTFSAGETLKTISFSATGDTIDDDGESVLLSFGSTLPAGVAEGAINETVVSVTERKFTALTEQPGISVPMCESNGMFVFWHAGIEFQDDPPPYGWRVERRHHSNGGWITTRFDFLGAESDALQTYSDEYWDWTDTTRRLDVDYTYRVRALDNDGNLMEGRNWSRRAPMLCR